MTRVLAVLMLLAMSGCAKKPAVLPTPKFLHQEVIASDGFYMACVWVELPKGYKVDPATLNTATERTMMTWSGNQIVACQIP